MHRRQALQERLDVPAGAPEEHHHQVDRHCSHSHSPSSRYLRPEFVASLVHQLPKVRRESKIRGHAGWRAHTLAWAARDGGWPVRVAVGCAVRLHGP